MKDTTFYLTLCLFAATHCLQAQEFEVVPPVQGGPSEIVAPSQVKEENNVISSASPQDSANAAFGGLVEAQGGFKVIQVGSGQGYLAVGQGTFNSDMPNPIAVRIAKANATVRAYLDAQRILAAGLNGPAVDEKVLVKEFTDSLDNEERSLLNSQNTQTETRRQAVSACLAAFILYEVTYKENDVFVSIIVTPKTRRALSAHRANKVTLRQAANAKAGAAFVKNDIKTMLAKNVIFLTGGKQIFVKPTNEFAFLGFGAEPVRYSENWPAIQKRRQKVLALETADSKAKANLLAMLQGTEVSYESTQYNMTSDEFREFEELKGEVSTFDSARKGFMNRQTTNTQFASAIKGQLPAGLLAESYYYDDNGDGLDDWAFSIAVYIPGVTAEADKVRLDVEEALNPPAPQRPKAGNKPNGPLPSGKTTDDNDL